MKSTLEIPYPQLRKVKSTAAERGQSLNDFVTEALREKLAIDKDAVSLSANKRTDDTPDQDLYA
jgi:hypothetical protein